MTQLEINDLNWELCLSKFKSRITGFNTARMVLLSGKYYDLLKLARWFNKIDNLI